MLRRDLASALIVSSAAAVVLSDKSQAQACTPPCFAQTPAEAAAGVTPTALQYPQGDPRRYGAVCDGVTDDITALTKWAKVGGSLTFPALTSKISAAIPMVSNTTLLASKGATITCSNPNISLFTATSKSKIIINGMGFVQTGTPATPYVAHVSLLACTDCRVTNCNSTGVCWSGVRLDGCTRCKVDTNYFAGALGTVQDRNDISIYDLSGSSSSYCEIINNWCYGGGANGIMILDPYAATSPNHNLVQGNYVGTHTQYGILVYIPGPGASGDTFNKVVDNWVDGITGAETINTESGAGIFLVGAWAGGTIISGNHVNNCCSATAAAGLRPAGIGIGLQTAGDITPPVITNNTITGMTQGHGIYVALTPSGALVEGNEIIIPASNNGTGPGGGALLGAGIRIETSNNVVLGPNNVRCLGTGSAVFFFAITTATSDNTMTGGCYESASGHTVRVSGSGVIASNHTFTGVRAKQTGNTSNAFELDSASGITMVGCIGTAGTQPALSITTVAGLEISGGRFTNTTNPAINANGVCMDSFIDQTVYWGGVAAGIVNTSTGLNITWRASAAPAAGQWTVGDTTEQNVPVVGNPKRWRCTVAGAPGTWVSEGNL